MTRRFIEEPFERNPVLQFAAINHLMTERGKTTRVLSVWSKKLEGDLSQHDCSTMEAHIVGCPACGAACDALKRALGACQRVRTDEVPPEIQARVKAAVRAWTAQGSLGR